MLPLHLFALRDDGFGRLVDENDEVSSLYLLYGSGDDLADPPGVFFQHPFPLCFTDPLDDDLFGREDGIATE